MKINGENLCAFVTTVGPNNLCNHNCLGLALKRQIEARQGFELVDSAPVPTGIVGGTLHYDEVADRAVGECRTRGKNRIGDIGCNMHEEVGDKIGNG